MTKQTGYATLAALIVWAVGVVAMSAMDDLAPGPERLYTPNGISTIYQDRTGQYSRALRGALRVDHERDS